MPTVPRKKPRTPLDFSMERAVGAADGKLVCGIDEVGRGPLAGPVVAAAVILPARGLPPSLARVINDSKTLKRLLREQLAPAIRTHARVGIGRAEVEEIDSLNILQATLLAMTRAVASLGIIPDFALVDGNKAPDLPCPVQTVIGGDGCCLSIAAASIVAKVERDHIMDDLARDHPGFGWERNAGYGTIEHLKALLLLGPTPHHRRSFAPVRRQTVFSD